MTRPWLPWGVLLLAYAGLIAVDPTQLPYVPRYLAFLLLGAVLPGYALVHRLLPVPDVRPWDKLLYGAVGGTGLVAVVGIVGATLRQHWLSATVLPLAPLGAWLLARDLRREREASADGSNLLAAGLFALAAVLVTVQFFIPSARPAEGAPGLYYQDWLWGLGNARAILNWGLPLHDLRMGDMVRSYHVAQYTFQIAAHLATGADLFDVQFRLEPLWDAFLLVLVTVRGMRDLLGTSLRATALVAVALLFTADFGGSVVGGGYWDPLTYQFGLPSFVLLHLLLYRALKTATPLPWYAAYLCFITTASKSTLIAYVGATVAGVVLWGVVREKRRLSDSTSLVLFLVALLPAGLFLKATVLSVGGEGYFGLWEVNKASFFYVLVYEKLRLGAAAPYVYEVYRFTKPFLASLVRTTLQWPAALLLVLAATLWRRTVWPVLGNVGRYALLFSVLSIGTISVIQVKGGVPYFFLYPQLLVLLAAGPVLDVLAAGRSGKAVWGVAAALTAGGIVSFARDGLHHARTFGTWPTAREHLWDPQATVTAGEWAALTWFKEHTPTDATFFTNRRMVLHESEGTPMKRSFVVSAFTGRQAFIEGDEFMPPPRKPLADLRWTLVESFLAGESCDVRGPLLAALPADYFVQFLRRGTRNYSCVDLVPVFENEAVRIWQRKGQRQP